MPIAFTVGELGVHGTMLNGKMLRYHDEVCVDAGHVPMGFTWSFDLAQRISEYRISLAKGIGGSALFNAGTGPLVIYVARPFSFSHWVYDDNSGLICLDEAELRARLADVCFTLQPKGSGDARD